MMASLLQDFAGQIDLIYIDRPFATGADFTVEVEMGDAEVTREASVIEELCYRDSHAKGVSSCLQMMYERLPLMRELLAENGILYIHLDRHVGHYVKLTMDEVFGRVAFSALPAQAIAFPANRIGAHSSKR